MSAIARLPGSVLFGLSCVLLNLTLFGPTPVAAEDVEEVVMLHWRGFEDTQGAKGDAVYATTALTTQSSTQVWLFQTPLGNRLAVRCVSQITVTNAWRSSCSIDALDIGWSFEREITRNIDVQMLPFSGGSLKEIDEVFDRMIENPHLVTETISSGEFFASYSAAEVLEEDGDQLLTVYGMKRLHKDGFSAARIPKAALDTISFAYRTNCVLRADSRDVEGDEFCQILEETGLVRLLPNAVNSYLKITRADEQQLGLLDMQPTSNALFLMKWGRLKLVKADGKAQEE